MYSKLIKHSSFNMSNIFLPLSQKVDQLSCIYRQGLQIKPYKLILQDLHLEKSCWF